MQRIRIERRAIRDRGDRYAVLPPDHPLASREYVRPEDVVGEPWIWVEGTDPETLAKELAGAQ